ncbi:MAG: acetate/propionate family kinase [Candidatus Buchananbacteria bacterium]
MDKILVINSGSATLKFKVFSLPNLVEEAVGIVERIGIDGSFIVVKSNGSITNKKFRAGLKNHGEAFEQVISALKKYLPEIKIVAHRVVHGGTQFTEATLVDNIKINELKKFNYLAPLHNPINIMCIEQALRLLPEAKEYAVFDTDYYKSMPEYACLYALPEKYNSVYGIRRYGFHGISHQYCALEAAKKLKKPIEKLKIISCHLGSGCSITATKNGKAVDTTMGFTPLEGLTMSTRAGDLDASIPLFLIERCKMKTEEISILFNKQSGLLGVAGTMDMREILTASGHKVYGYVMNKNFTKIEREKCTLALKMFIYDIVRYVGQFITIMKGADAVVFTGGIGERSPVVRNLILKEIKFLGKIKSFVVPADEELMMARRASLKEREFKRQKIKKS